MKKGVMKLAPVFAAGVIIPGSMGCGDKGPATANNITVDERQKLISSSEILTAADETELNVD